VVIIDFIPDLCLDMIAKYRVTKTVPVATMLNLLVDIQARSPRDPSSLKHFGMGGAPVSIDTVLAAREVFDIDFVQYFGQTEATVQLTYLSKYDYRRGLSPKASEQDKMRLMSGAGHSTCARQKLSTTMPMWCRWAPSVRFVDEAPKL